jgi:RNA polymerase sigma factor (sigma-70 family)
MKRNNFSTEEEILVGLRSQNELAIQQVYKSHFPMVLHFILGNNGTEQEAKDIYQEAFIIFYEKLQEDLNLTCKIKTYLYSICRRQWLKRLYEKNKFTGGIDEMEEFLDVEQDIQKNEEKEKDFIVMEASLISLGEPCKTLITDFYIQNMNMEEIADKFGYTNSDNAKNQKYKCLQRLKKIFFGNFKSE